MTLLSGPEIEGLKSRWAVFSPTARISRRPREILPVFARCHPDTARSVSFHEETGQAPRPVHCIALMARSSWIDVSHTRAIARLSLARVRTRTTGGQSIRAG